MSGNGIDLDALKAAVPLRQLVERRGVKLKRSGRNWQGLCPFHAERSASFTVYDDGHFHCYACKAHGDVIEFVQRIDKLSFTAARDRLANEAGLTNGTGKQNGEDWLPIVPPPADAPRPTDQQLRCDMLHEYIGADNRILFYVRRHEAKGDKRKQFYPLTYGTLNGKTGWHTRAPDPVIPLYGLNRLSHAEPEATVILCEGEKKADAVQRLFPTMVGMAWMGGAQADDKNDYSPLHDRRVILWPDADKVGRDATSRIAKRLRHVQMIETVDLPDGYDAADLEGDGCDDPAAWLAARLRGPAPEPEPEPQPQPITTTEWDPWEDPPPPEWQAAFCHVSSRTRLRRLAYAMGSTSACCV
jgi:hypothetical protein